MAPGIVLAMFGVWVIFQTTKGPLAEKLGISSGPGASPPAVTNPTGPPISGGGPVVPGGPSLPGTVYPGGTTPPTVNAPTEGAP